MTAVPIHLARGQTKGMPVPHRSTADKDSLRLREMASVANAEPIGSAVFFVHVGLLTFGAFAVIALYDIWHFAGIILGYVGLLTLEKAVAARAVRQSNARLYHLVLALLGARALAYNVLVVAVWTIEGDIFKMAALALLVAGTINIFVFHATYPQIILAVCGPIWLGIACIAVLIYADTGLSVQTLSAVLIVICITPYFYLTLSKAQKKFGELDETRDALQQSQKQDALGKLVSGVAHDFNNILAVTLGSAELIKEASAADKNKLADEIIKAAERGASLTAQLLAFGRRSQLAPAGHPVRDIFQDFHVMLDRVLPEYIATTLSVAPGTPHIFVDRHQLETALINLAVNARDAMPEGGTLDIHAGAYNLRPGDPLEVKRGLAPGCYTYLRVTDSGSGVAKQIIGDVFDPFFTTKSTGEGSGLGLSMVLGFVQQSGGAVTFDSAVGLGTTVTLYLPSTTELAVQEAPDDLTPAVQWGNAARVLLVEDEAQLREVFAHQLTAGGYDVTVAANGQEAECLLRGGPQPDILVTDLVMPGTVQGVHLARIARAQVRDMPIVFVSGYPDGALAQTLVTDSSFLVLRKPVRKEDLLAAVQKSLHIA